MSSWTEDERRWMSDASLALLAILVAFIVTSTINVIYSSVFVHGTLIENYQSWTLNSRTMLLICQVLIFLLLLARFYGGAYRFHQNMGYSELKISDKIFNLVSTFVLFSFFYVISQTILNTDLFYFAIFIMHAWDFIWFMIVLNLSSLKNNPASIAVKKFLLWDTITIFFFLISWPIFGAVWEIDSQYYRQWMLLLVLLIISLVDFRVLRVFYFYPKDWRTEHFKEATE